VRICFLAGTLGQGGAEQQLFYIVRALRDSGTPVRVLSLTANEFWEAAIRQLGVPVTWVGRSRSRLARLSAVVQDLRRSPVDIIQSQHFYTSTYVVAAARILGIREIGAIRCDTFTEQRDVGLVMGRLSLFSPRTIAANSEAAIRNAVAMGVPRSRLFLLPNVVDTTRFSVSSQPKSGPIKLISVGRLTAQKRVDRFLAMVHTLRDRLGRDVRGIIVGDGPDRHALETQARELGLVPHTVEFRGVVRSTEDTYHEADVLVLTSDYEGTPNVVVEAMACGLPVVATGVGEVPSLVRPGKTGYVVTPGDEAELLSAVRDLVDSASLRQQFGQDARQRVEDNFSAHQLPRLLGDLYAVALRSRQWTSIDAT
jgi:glycosyltransferase involved in cell wall biosynthesis